MAICADEAMVEEMNRLEVAFAVEIKELSKMIKVGSAVEIGRALYS